jgi:hypothetical protein
MSTEYGPHGDTPEPDAVVNDLQPLVGSAEDLALPAYGQHCDDCLGGGHTSCASR